MNYLKSLLRCGLGSFPRRPGQSCTAKAERSEIAVKCSFGKRLSASQSFVLSSSPSQGEKT